MNNRDRQILDKILKEIDVATDMVNGVSENSFLDDEKLKRAVCMTLINIGELVKNQLTLLAQLLKLDNEKRKPGITRLSFCT